MFINKYINGDIDQFIADSRSIIQACGDPEYCTVRINKNQGCETTNNVP